jgi:hypothetical protein
VSEVFVEVERIRRRALPDRRVARHRLVPGELGLEHALAAGQAGEPAAEILEE